MKLSKEIPPMLKTDGNISSMRWAFILTTKVVLVTTVGVIFASVLGSFFNVHVDLIGISAILSPVSLFAFGGKATQTAFEKNTEVPTSVPTVVIHYPVKESGGNSLDNPNA